MRLRNAAVCLLVLHIASRSAATRVMLQDKAAQQVAGPNSAGTSNLDRIVAFTQLPIGPKLDSTYRSGYITLDAAKGHKFFYVFGEAQQDPQNKPLLFWMNGGPGCSSVGLGWLQGNGPLIPVSTGGKVVANKHSLTSIANVLWVEQPAFTGFSTSNDEAHRTSGHYGPMLAKRILDHNEAVNKKVVQESNRNQLQLNLAGLAMGNAWTDAYYDNEGTVDFWYDSGIISRDVYDGLKKCDLSTGALWRTDGPSGFNPECEKLRNQAYAQIGKINQYGLNAPICLGAGHKYPLADPDFEGFQMWDPCAGRVVREIMNMRDVQLQLGVITPSEPTRQWSSCVGKNLTYSLKDMTTSMVPVYRHLINKGVPVMIYSGETDAYVTLAGTRAWVESMNLPLLNSSELLRQWKDTHTDQLGGSVVEYKGLTRVSVRNSGHSVGGWSPRKNVQLLGTFLNGQRLPSFVYST